LTCLDQKLPKRTPNETISESNGTGTEFAPLNANEHERNANDFYREVPLIRQNFPAPSNFKRYWTEIFPFFFRSVKISFKGLPLGSVRYRLV
jgi:hypothetical protein